VKCDLVLFCSDGNYSIMCQTREKLGELS